MLVSGAVRDGVGGCGCCVSYGGLYSGHAAAAANGCACGHSYLLPYSCNYSQCDATIEGIYTHINAYDCHSNRNNAIHIDGRRTLPNV